MNTNKNKKILFISIVVFICLSIILIIAAVINNNSNKVFLDNFDNYIHNISTDDKNSIFQAIYKKVQEYNTSNNLPTANNYHGIIRENSVNIVDSVYEKFTNHKATVIIDIDSLKYSYYLTFQWIDTQSIQPKDEDSDRAQPTLYCLPENEAIYNDFKCSSPDDPETTYNPFSLADLYISQDCWGEPLSNTDGVRILFYPSDEDFENNTVKEKQNICTAELKTSLKNQGVNIDDLVFEEKIKYFR